MGLCCCSRKGDGYNEPGVRRSRGCTDILCLLIFLIFWGGAIGMAVWGIARGDIRRLTRGTDSLAKHCGIIAEEPPSYALRDSKWPAAQGGAWANRQKVWYPLTFDITDMKTSIQLGVCVDACPQTNGAEVQIYDNSVIVPYDKSAKSWPVLYDSEAAFGWCLPKHEAIGSAPEAIQKALTKFIEETPIGHFMWRGFTEIVSAWRVIVICFVAAIVLCFVWLILLRCFVGPLIYGTLILVLLLLVGGGVVAFVYHQRLKDSPNDTLAPYATYFLIGAIVLWVIAVLYLCLLIFMIRRIRIAVAIIRHAAQVLATSPTTFLIPVVVLILVAINVAWWICISALIETAQDSDLEAAVTTPDGKETIAHTNYTKPSALRVYFHLYYLFMFLWTNAFFSAFCFVAVAYVGGYWYFSNIDKPSKRTPPCTVLYSMVVVLRYHIGTVAFGSLLVAIVQFLRYLARRFVRQLKNNGGGCLAVALGCCIECCLNCCERIIKFINKNAYVMTAIKGSSFCPSAAKALSLLMSNALRVAATDLLGGVVIFFGKVLIALACVGLGHLLIRKTSMCTDCDSGAWALVLIGVIGYIVASLLLGILSTLIYTLIMCFCLDIEENNGHDKPYYMTPELANITGYANEPRQPPVNPQFQYKPNDGFNHGAGHPPPPTGPNTPEEGGYGYVPQNTPYNYHNGPRH